MTELAVRIRKRLATLVEDAHPVDVCPTELEVALQALELYVDMTGWIALRPDGELIFVRTARTRRSRSNGPP